MIMFLSPRKAPGGKSTGVAAPPARVRTITTPAAASEPEPAAQPG
jgi:hypothetical protein